MKRFIVMLAVVALFGNAQAATVAVQNGDFEAPYTLSHGGTLGLWDYGAAGWFRDGTVAGTYAPNFENVYSSAPPELDSRVGFVNADSYLAQDLGLTVEADTGYALTALFGNRTDTGFGGEFGFFVGDSSNIIGKASINDPGDGLWGSQTLFLDAIFMHSFVGKELGIIFLGVTGQINFDNVIVEAFYDGPKDQNVLVNPVPGAVWLFGTAIAGGFFARRRAKRASAK